MTTLPLPVLGIDGGGTRTRALLVAPDGTPIGYGEAAGSNFQSVGVTAAKAQIASAVEEAWLTADARPQRAAAVFLGLAGVVSETDRERITSMARLLDLGERIGVDHDICTTLAGGLAGRAGIALIVGTGSAAYGRNAEGRTWRSGGWGAILDDVGSGYWLGREALTAIARATDGRGPATALTSAAMRELHITTLNELPAICAEHTIDKGRIAALAPVVLAMAGGEDAVAGAIAAHGAAELAAMVAATANGLALPADVEVATTGGVLQDAFYAAMIRAAINERLPGARIAPALFPPVVGAALLALELAGVEAGDAVRARLAAEWSIGR